MKHVASSLSLVFSRRDSLLVIIATTLLFILFLFASHNGNAALSILSFDSLLLSSKFSLAFSTLFDIRDTFTQGALLLAFLGSLVGGINMALAYTYVRLRGEVIVRSGMYSGLGLLLAFLGVGCAACGTALLSIILSFFGFSALLAMLPYQGLEIGYIGIIILCIATYSLSKKLHTPNVC